MIKHGIFEKIHQKIIAAAIRSVNDDDLRMQLNFRWTNILLSFLVASLGIINLVEGYYSMGKHLLILAVVYLAEYLLVLFYKRKGLRIATWITSIGAVVLAIHFIRMGNANGFSAAWIVVFPSVLLLLIGRKKGTIVCGLTFLIAVFFLWTPLGRSLTNYDYSQTHQIRIPLIYGYLFFVTYLSESLRSIMIGEIKDSKRRLAETYTLQYSRLEDRIADARRVRHDTRHHFIYLDSLLQNGKIDEARTYLQNQAATIQQIDSLYYCDNYTANALFSYYSQQADANKILYNVSAAYPEDLPLSHEDLVVIIGNLLENAVTACIHEKNQDPASQPYISVAGKCTDHALLLIVKNFSMRKAVKDNNEQFFSTKHSGHGLGITSVQNIAEKHNGNLKIEQTEDTFIASLYLYI